MHFTPTEDAICSTSTLGIEPTLIRLEKAVTVPASSECIFPANLVNPVEPGTTGLVEIYERLSEKYNVLGASILFLFIYLTSPIYTKYKITKCKIKYWPGYHHSHPSEPR